MGSVENPPVSVKQAGNKSKTPLNGNGASHAQLDPATLEQAYQAATSELHVWERKLLAYSHDHTALSPHRLQEARKKHRDYEALVKSLGEKIAEHGKLAELAELAGPYEEIHFSSDEGKNENKAKGKETEKEPPRPLRRDIPPAEPFPLDALAALASPTQVLANAIQAPLALCGQSILAAATLAVQAHRDIYLEGRVMPLSEYYLTIGESGERKSAVDKEALRPHRIYERERYLDYEEEKRDYDNAADAYQKTREEALKKAKTFHDKKEAVKALGIPPRAPLLPVFITEEPTYEGLVKLLQVGLPSIGLFSAEGGRMIGGYGMSETQELKTACGLSELWDGNRISRVRGGDGASLLYGRRVSTHLMAQPEVAQRLLSNPLMTEQGLLSRFLVTWPTSTAGTRMYKPIDLRKDPDLLKYEKQLKILRTSPRMAEGKQNELNPKELLLNAEAKRQWVEFHNEVESQLGENQKYAPIRGFANKAPEHAVRLSGDLTLYGDLNAEAIVGETVWNGVILAKYYLSEALRLFQSGATDPDLVLAEKLLAWAKAWQPSYFCLADIYQRGPNAIREKATARKITSILEDHGWFIRETNGREIDGVQRKEVWSVYREKSEN